MEIAKIGETILDLARSLRTTFDKRAVAFTELMEQTAADVRSEVLAEVDMALSAFEEREHEREERGHDASDGGKVVDLPRGFMRKGA